MTQGPPWRPSRQLWMHLVQCPSNRLVNALQGARLARPEVVASWGAPRPSIGSGRWNMRRPFQRSSLENGASFFADDGRDLDDELLICEETSQADPLLPPTGLPRAHRLSDWPFAGPSWYSRINPCRVRVRTPSQRFPNPEHSKEGAEPLAMMFTRILPHCRNSAVKRINCTPFNQP